MCDIFQIIYGCKRWVFGLLNYARLDLSYHMPGVRLATVTCIGMKQSRDRRYISLNQEVYISVPD